MKAKLQRLALLGTQNAKRLGAAVTLGALTAAPAFAQAQEQPDVAAVVAYLLAGIATLALVGNARLIVRGAMAVFRWVGSMIR